MENQAKIPVSIYKERLIGFFDVLGFSRLLSELPLEELHIRYAALIDHANLKVFSPKTIKGSKVPQEINFEKTQFLFDSIVLVSNSTDEIKNISRFIMASNFLMESAFQSGFPLRGCITIGDFLGDAARTIFLSAEFSGLFKAEKQQEWTGCYLMRETEKLVLPAIFGEAFYRNIKNEKIRRNMPLLPYRVPFKRRTSDSSECFWCLNWCYMLNSDVLKTGVDRLISPKKEHTLRFVDHANQLPDETAGLPDGFKPAISMKAMKTRSQMRIQFLDQDGKQTEPGCKDFTIVAFEKTGG